MKPKYIIHDNTRGLVLGFDEAEEALAFLTEQSSNPAWRALWTLNWVPTGVTLTCREYVSVTL